MSKAAAHSRTSGKVHMPVAQGVIRGSTIVNPALCPTASALHETAAGPASAASAWYLRTSPSLICAGQHLAHRHVRPLSCRCPATGWPSLPQQLQCGARDPPAYCLYPFIARLQDHPACLSSFIVNEESGPISVTDEIYGPSGRVRLKAVLNWLVRRRGPLTTTGCDHGAFVNTLGELEPAHLALSFCATGQS